MRNGKQQDSIVGNKMDFEKFYNESIDFSTIDIKEIYDKFNKKLFGNKLPKDLKFEVKNMKSMVDI